MTNIARRISREASRVARASRERVQGLGWVQVNLWLDDYLHGLVLPHIHIPTDPGVETWCPADAASAAHTVWAARNPGVGYPDPCEISYKYGQPWGKPR